MNKKLFVLVAMAVLIGGCSLINKSQTTTNNNSIKTDQMTKKENLAKKEQTPKNVILHTSEGDITIKVLPKSAPQTVESFWKLSRDGKYDNVPFHRVIKDFMIQTGDYENKNGTGGQSWFGEAMKNEIDAKLSHKRGMVSMANAGPDTNGSQFFIVHQDSAFLDGSYSIFGEIVAGIDIVDEIAETETEPGDRPVKEIVIKNTTLEY